MRKTKKKRAAKFEGLIKAARYKVFYGGRGGAKSWMFARVLVRMAAQGCLRILCARQFQASISDSVHRLISDQIHIMGLDSEFSITEKSIKSATGSEFLFKGLEKSIREIKSTEGIDICWVEEAQSVADSNWEILIPTVRKERSEIWISFNPYLETDPTYQRFVVNPPPDSIVVKVGWEDNPWFPSTLDKERLHMMATDIDAYNHVWGGYPVSLSDSVIFSKRVSVAAFEPPEDVRWLHGADWGFANDPTALIRFYIHEECLWIESEQFGYGVEIDELPELFRAIPTSAEWPIKADGARPETISYMRRQGFAISAADKWPGSVEDGVAHLKGFKKIIIHERCKHMIDEARLYSYKKDKTTGEILPVIVDKHNHGWDAIRYGLDGYIQSRGAMGLWTKLAG